DIEEEKTVIADKPSTTSDSDLEREDNTQITEPPNPPLRQHDREPAVKDEPTIEVAPAKRPLEKTRQAPPKPPKEAPPPPPTASASTAIELEDLINTRTITPMTFVWITGSVLLLLSLFIQNGYHNRLTLAQDPDTRESIVSLCGYLGCDLPPMRDVDRITIKRRDVREQNSIPKTLLINLTIMNQARFVQPYPEIQITLYDAQKNEIGKRRFASSEFISNQDMLERGMPPKTPTHIEFEVVAPQAGTEGFTFDFF
ncbi:MAG: DUF3426 domain-containing protein, partial [Methylococcales bacterium]|nr:DUF3426 domain-containing protein [Methylococcales bacterium]